MLYDNALLTIAYLEAFQHDGGEDLADAAATTLDWVRREMQGPEGGYYATLDADSEGEEGKYYVWSLEEVVDLLGDDAPDFVTAYDVSKEGNWEGTNIVNQPRPLSAVARELDREEEALREQLQANLATLRDARESRVRPGLDDKILSDWNGLMIAAMARGYRVLGDSAYLDSARAAAEFVLDRLDADGRLMHNCRGDQIGQPAYLDGYANMMWACIELFEATFEMRWLNEARRLADGMIELFWDDEDEGFHFTGRDQEVLIARPKSGHDGATPSGNAIAATWLARLARWTGEPEYARRAHATVQAFGEGVRRAPTGFAQLLLALTDSLGHALDDRSRRIQRAEEVDVDVEVAVFERRIDELLWPVPARAASHVHEEIDRPKRALDGRDALYAGRGIPEIDGDSKATRPFGSERRLDRREVAVVEVSDTHGCALACQRLRDDAPDSATRPRHERHSSGQIEHRASPRGINVHFASSPKPFTTVAQSAP